MTANVPRRPSAEEIDRILALTDDEKDGLAVLLHDSVKHGFTSLAEAERHDRDELRRRIEDVDSGRAETRDAREVLARLREKLAVWNAP